MSTGTDIAIRGKDFVINDWVIPIIGGILIVVAIGGAILYWWNSRSS